MRVHRASILALGRNAYSREETESWAAGLVPEGYGRAMTEGGEIFLLAEAAGGQIIAFCSYRADEIAGLFVDPAWARRGVGRALLERAEAAIAAAGHGKIRVGASLTGRPFYEAQGYVVVREREWTTRGGLKTAVLEMEKRLT
jgi:putative acetyltransferase